MNDYEDQGYFNFTLDSYEDYFSNYQEVENRTFPYNTVRNEFYESENESHYSIPEEQHNVSPNNPQDNFQLHEKVQNKSIEDSKNQISTSCVSKPTLDSEHKEENLADISFCDNYFKQSDEASETKVFDTPILSEEYNPEIIIELPSAHNIILQSQSVEINLTNDEKEDKEDKSSTMGNLTNSFNNIKITNKRRDGIFKKFSRYRWIYIMNELNHLCDINRYNFIPHVETLAFAELPFNEFVYYPDTEFNDKILKLRLIEIFRYRWVYFHDKYEDLDKFLKEKCDNKNVFQNYLQNQNVLNILDLNNDTELRKSLDRTLKTATIQYLESNEFFINLEEIRIKYCINKRSNCHGANKICIEKCYEYRDEFLKQAFGLDKEVGYIDYYEKYLGYKRHRKELINNFSKNLQDEKNKKIFFKVIRDIQNNESILSPNKDY
jgi:hypothetical protein